ncbi:MAG: ABC transporter ATP-binding protein [Lachnospiraceae bacterium]
MIELKNVSYKYTDDITNNNGIINIDLSVRKGEFVLLTGESGCGKTTLTRVLNGLCPKFYGGTSTGEYKINGNDTADMTLNEIGMLTGSVFQDPRSQFFTTNTTDEIVLAMENRCYSKIEMDERLEQIADLLDIKSLLNRSLFELSSGEKQKIAIAAACAVNPPVLILDEPTANLDGNTIEQLTTLLGRLKAKGYTIIVSEHRLYYLRHLFDRMLYIEHGKIIKEYSAKAANVLSDEMLKRMGLRLFAVPDFLWPANNKRAEKFTAEALNLKLSRNNMQILDNLSISLPVGSVTAVTGHNGAGKTTTCRVLSGILKEQSGTVLYQGKAVKTKKRVKECFFVQQDADYQLYTPNVWNEVTLNLKKDTYTEDEVLGLLERMNLNELKERHPNSLSGGQKQRVLLAAAILKKSPVMIFDEPTSGLDGKHMREIAAILRQTADSGASILLITHDREFIDLVADNIVYMEHGTVKEIRSRSGI